MGVIGKVGRGGFEPPTLARFRGSPCKGDVLTELDDRPEAPDLGWSIKGWNDWSCESDFNKSWEGEPAPHGR